MHGATTFEVYALFAVLGTAIAGLLYALLLSFQVLKEDKGTPRMLEISNAILSGSNAYLKKQ